MTTLPKEKSIKLIKKYDQKMKFLLKVLKNPEEEEIHSEFLIDISNIITTLGEKSVQYLPQFFPILLEHLVNFQDRETCIVAINVVGDISRAIPRENFLLYLKEIMKILFTNLIKLGTSNMEIYAETFACFGDIALVTGKHFETYLSNVMKILEASCKIKCDKSDPSSVFLFNHIREHVLDAYTGIIQGFKNDQSGYLFESYIPHVIKFVQIAYSDENKNEDIKRAAVGVIGDLGQTFGSKISKDLQTQSIRNILNDAMKSTDSSIKKVAVWSKGIVDKL